MRIQIQEESSKLQLKIKELCDEFNKLEEQESKLDEEHTVIIKKLTKKSKKVLSKVMVAETENLKKQSLLMKEHGKELIEGEDHGAKDQNSEL